MRKKILVISYYWPPASGGGIQRILKFCKYSIELGFEPTVITGTVESLKLKDTSLEEDSHNIIVHRVPLWFDPVRWFISKNKDKKKNSNQNKKYASFNLIKKIKIYVSNFIWLNFFIPDSKIGLYFSARKKIKNILEHEYFDAVITTGPPYTPHLLGLFIKKKYNLPWIVDVRDPWVENNVYNVTYRFTYVISLNKWLEKKVLANCNTITTVGNLTKNLLSTKINSDKIHVIYNGFDCRDFKNFQKNKINYFRLGYYGLMNDQRIPYSFINALSQRLNTDKEFAHYFKWKIYGNISPRAIHTLKLRIPPENLIIKENISHDKLIVELAKEQLLLLLVSNMRGAETEIPGKIFEYLHTGWPILGIGPLKGEARLIIDENKAGKLFEYNESKDHIQWLVVLFNKWKKGNLEQKMISKNIYNRRYQAYQLCLLLNDIIHN